MAWFKKKAKNENKDLILSAKKSETLMNHNLPQNNEKGDIIALF